MTWPAIAARLLPVAADAWDPDQYDRFKKERSQPFFDLLALLQPCERGQAIDLGCGTGELTAALHRNVRAERTIGIDASPAMLRKAASHAGHGLVFRLGDISEWSEPGEYDLVFSNAALQWCPDHRQILARARDSLRAGGQLAVQMPMNHNYPTHALAREMSREEPWATLLKPDTFDPAARMLTPEGYASLLHGLGFKEQKVLSPVYGHVLASREDVVEWVKGTLLTFFESRLREDRYQDFLAEFRARLFRALPDDAPFFYPFTRILIWARR